MADEDEKAKHFEEKVKVIEIPKSEIQVFQEIQDYMEVLAIDSGETFQPRKSQHSMAELIDEKTKEMGSDIDSVPPSEKLSLEFKIKRAAEYEAYKGEIDFRNDQLHKLIEFIESKNIWKCKFSTSKSVGLGQYDGREFVGDGSESKKYDQKNSFAGQSRDSIYFVSKSGLSLRLKVDRLFTEGGFKDVLQFPKELIIFLNRREKDRKNLEIRSGSDFQDYPQEIISFEPRLGYNVEEFRTSNFGTDTTHDYKSEIQVTREKGRVIVRNYQSDHSGHQVNRIFFS